MNRNDLHGIRLHEDAALFREALSFAVDRVQPAWVKAEYSIGHVSRVVLPVGSIWPCHW